MTFSILYATITTSNNHHQIKSSEQRNVLQYIEWRLFHTESSWEGNWIERAESCTSAMRFVGGSVKVWRRTTYLHTRSAYSDRGQWAEFPHASRYMALPGLHCVKYVVTSPEYWMIKWDQVCDAYGITRAQFSHLKAKKVEVRLAYYRRTSVSWSYLYWEAQVKKCSEDYYQNTFGMTRQEHVMWKPKRSSSKRDTSS